MSATPGAGGGRGMPRRRVAAPMRFTDSDLYLCNANPGALPRAKPLQHRDISHVIGGVRENKRDRGEQDRTRWHAQIFYC